MPPFLGGFFMPETKGDCMTGMPKDIDGNPIPALGFKDDGAHQIAATTAAARNAVAFGADVRVITYHCDVASYVKLGGDDVAASLTDHYIPAGQYLAISIGGGAGRPHHTHISVILPSGTGAVHISET